MNSPQQRVEIAIGGVAMPRWLSFTLARDLRDIAGRFTVSFFDAGRAAAALPGAPAPSPLPAPVQRRQSVTITLDGDLVLDGWIDGMEGEWTSDALNISISGRDKTGDLADCSAAPTGPGEWRNATLLQIAQQVCAPFGITVRAATDTGAPFKRLAINPHESALSLLEKAARQRAVLLVSDGVGGLLLTSGGRARAAADIRAGGNAQRLAFQFDDTRRFSDIYVKGQSEKAAGQRTLVVPPMDHDWTPGELASLTGAQATEAKGILITGHAVDREVTRYRPHVRLTRTQSGSATGQQQAEWAVRLARGESTSLRYTVLDWRVDGTLWKPNTVARVYDPYAGIDDDMLIRAVTYRSGPDGAQPQTPLTDIEVVGVTAFDRIDEPQPRRPLKVR